MFVVVDGGRLPSGGGWIANPSPNRFPCCPAEPGFGYHTSKALASMAPVTEKKGHKP